MVIKCTETGTANGAEEVVTNQTELDLGIGCREWRCNATDKLPESLAGGVLMPQLSPDLEAPAKVLIKEWEAHERPREKLATFGSASLTEAELLAVLFGTGSGGKDVITWSRDVLKTAGGLGGLLSLPKERLLEIPGIGLARSMQIQAILELTRRYLASSLRSGEGFTRPEMVKDYLAAQLRHQDREVFAILLLDSQHRLLHYCELFYGTINAAPVYPREIIKLVMRHNAAAVILAHNHPSGVAEPSQADQRVTTRIREALSTIDVALLDHFVIGAGETVSFAERGWL